MTAVGIDRVAYRQARARRSTGIALLSTVVFAAVVLVAVTSAPGWSRVQNSFFNLRVGWDSLPALLSGLWLNIRVLIVCQILVLLVGLALLIPTFWGLVLFPVAVLLVRWGAIRPEERFLHARFGAPYDDYTRRVRRWL